MPLLDAHQRPLGNLRLSVTDRCNLRCSYCMPETEYVWLPREQILRFEETVRLVEVFADLGVDRLRLTGGEPLLRRDLPVLVRMLAALGTLRDLALTTNGVLLEGLAAPLAEAGLQRVTVSLDSLRSEVFRELTRQDALERVLSGIEAASRAGFRSLKIDSVILRGRNDGELSDLLEYGRRVGAEVRFIEYMDVGGATRWSMDQVVSRQEILARLEARYGPIGRIPEVSSAPAERFRLRDGTALGIIASTTAPFCGSCDRSRLTADGLWYLCLYARTGLDLGQLLRAGATRAELRAAIEGAWRARTDRGAEERLRLASRGALERREALREDPHLEMHTRGG